MAQAAQALRTLEGIEVPSPGVWEFDKSHSRVGFVARHLMISKVRGVFERYDGAVTIGETPEESAVEVTIEAASITTRDEKRDGHLVSADFLDAAAFPALRYASRRVERTGDTSLRIEGDLTIRGVTQPVTLEAEFVGVATDPWGTAHAGFTARAEIDREAFGITWNQALETGGVLVGKRVQIDLDIQLVRAS